MLNLQVIPWCFQLLGNRFPCVKLPPEPPVATIKLVKSDGLVKIYDRPINVSELMTEFPKHLVCRSDSLYIGQKIPALSEDDQLQLGHIYFLLPKHCFQSVLSFVTIASFANFQAYQLPRLPKQPFSSSSSSSSSSFSGSAAASDSIDMRKALVKKMTSCRQPFHIQKTQSGGLRIRVSDEFISQLMEQGKLEETEENDQSRKGRVCTNPQLHKDYEQLVGSRLIWKPKLDTIRESTEKKRKLILSSSFGMMNTRNIIVKKSSDVRPSSSSSSSSSKGLIIHKHKKTSGPKSASSASEHHLPLDYTASPKQLSSNSKSKSKTKKIKIHIKSRK